MLLAKLNTSLEYLLSHSAFYQERFNGCPTTLDALEDLQNFPLTTKDDLNLYNEAFCCVDAKQIVEWVTTSGSLGEPVHMPMSKKDLERLANNEAHSFQLMNVSEQDIVQLMLTLDKQFMAGMAYYLGAQKHGATVIRTGPGAMDWQLKQMQHYGTTVLVAVPSFLYKLINYAKKKDFDFSVLKVKKVLCIGESLYDHQMQATQLLKNLQQWWPVDYYNTYASTEMQTAFTDCCHHNGSVINESLIYVEIVDEKGKPVPDGTIGEVVVTTLGVEALPLWRYRTGDLAMKTTAQCDCSPYTGRLSGVVGRKQQMLKFKGTTLFPQTLLDCLNSIPELGDYQIEIQLDNNHQDDVTIWVSNLHLPMDKFKSHLVAQLRVCPHIVEITQADMLRKLFPNDGRKPMKIIDKRY